MIVDHDHILNSDSIFTVLIKSGLVRHAHANFKFDSAATMNALRALMHTVERADSMASSMLVINTVSPQMSSGQCIEIRATIRTTLWPNNSLKI